MSRDLRWDDLRAFLAVARGGTLAAAGQELGVDASTVHRRIAALEEALGEQLFLRDPRGYALTELGEGLVPHAEQADEAVHAVRRAVTGGDASARGPVRLTMAETLVEMVAPHLDALRAAHPGVVPELSVDPRLVDLGRETDVALRVSATPPEAAVGRRLGRVGWAVYGMPGATLDGRWVVYQGLDQVAAVRWRRRVHPDVHVALRVNGVSAMQRALPGLRAVGLLPCYCGDHTPGLVRLGAPVAEAATDLWLLVHADLRRSARVRALVDFLVPRLLAEAPRLEG